MDNMVDKTAIQPKIQADAFRTWLSARKHFGAGAAVGGGAMDHGRRTSAPAIVMFQSPKGAKVGQGNARPDTERAREYLGQAVASQNKIEQLQEEGFHGYSTSNCACIYVLYQPVK